MRLNQYIAQATGLSRRAADELVQADRVSVNGSLAKTGDQVNADDQVLLDGKLLKPAPVKTVLLNKPAGYICSRAGQGSRTIYDLLPAELQNLKPVGRLDKDSSGLLLLTNDGQLANRLTHPRYNKTKIYEVRLDKPLSPEHRKQIIAGIQLDDGPSRLQLAGRGRNWQVKMSEGRNRQIRRTFAALGYKVETLHRTHFGPYKLNGLTEKECSLL